MSTLCGLVLALYSEQESPAMRTVCVSIVVATLVGSSPEAVRADVQIDADYPGGNVLIESIDGDVVQLRQDLRDTAGWWFYWSFRVRGAEGRTLTFRFTNKNVIGTRGPAVSRDAGRTWSWLGIDAVEDASSFAYTFPIDADLVRFAFAPQYQQTHLDRFLRQHQGNEHVAVRELCRTRKGRPVERIHAGNLAGAPKYRILLTCRHHCCESMASYALEGMLAALLDDTEDGRWFQEHAEVLAVPFMDKDGVEQGDQGKNRKPHDHNRDYGGESLYPSVAALRKLVPQWSEGRLRVALDLHCPYIRGAHNEVIYLVGSQNQAIWQEQCRFGSILESVSHSTLPYHTADNLPFGRAWNTEKNYGAGTSCSRWAGELKGVRLASTIEIPYANVGSTTVTPNLARAFGTDMVRALRRYLDESSNTGGGDVPTVPHQGEAGVLKTWP